MKDSFEVTNQFDAKHQTTQRTNCGWTSNKIKQKYFGPPQAHKQDKLWSNKIIHLVNEITLYKFSTYVDKLKIIRVREKEKNS